MAADERYGIVKLDAAKQAPYDRIREDGAFDLVIGNPPYVAEAGNKVLFDRLRALPGWDGEYRGKGDYLYYFLAMAAEKVAPGGRLCVITPAAWMNSGRADWLRERLASDLRLDELYLFGSMRLFATERAEREVRTGVAAPLIESAILVATKADVPPDHRLRVVVLADEAAAARALTGDPEARTPPREELLALMATRADGRRGRANGILVHGVVQARLRSTQPWPVKHTARELAVRVVAHLERALNEDRSQVEPLRVRWIPASGIETGADALSTKIQRRLDDRARSALAAHGLQTGDPILQLPPGMESRAPWSRHPEVLARAPEARAILYGAIDAEDYTSLVWIGRDDEAPPAVIEALEPWRDVLRTRAEFRRNGSRSWWETAWPRDREALRGPKVIALHRTARGRFALDEDGSWQATKNATTIVPRHGSGPVAFLCAVLNSELLDLWYAVRGRIARDVWRDYEPQPMNEMPCRHVSIPDGWVASERVDSLRSGIVGGDFAGALDAAADIRQAIGSDQGDADALAGVEHLVRAVAANRSALLPLRSIAPELRRAVKNPWRTHGVRVDRAAVVAHLPTGQVRSVRLDPELALSVNTDGALGHARIEDGDLIFRHARRLTARVEGPPERLALLADLIGTRRIMPEDLRTTIVPASLTMLAAEVVRSQDQIDGLLDIGRRLVESVERLVCALYGVPDPLTDLVVESAVARAGTVAQAGD